MGSDLPGSESEGSEKNGNGHTEGLNRAGKQAQAFVQPSAQELYMCAHTGRVAYCSESACVVDVCDDVPCCPAAGKVHGIYLGLSEDILQGVATTGTSQA